MASLGFRLVLGLYKMILPLKADLAELTKMPVMPQIYICVEWWLPDAD